MTKRTPWWRKVGAALAGLVLAVVAFGPAIDGLLCQDDALAAAAATLSPAVDAPDGLAGDTAGERCVLGACVHGHCNHTAQLAPALCGSQAGVSDPTDAGLSRGEPALPPSAYLAGLKRPPRA